MATKIEVNLKVTVQAEGDDIDSILENLTDHVGNLNAYDEYALAEDVEIADWKKADT